MISRDSLQHIRRVEIRSWRLAEEYLAGAYRSVFKGRGMDFESVREYCAGDEVRRIDWNVSARMNAPFVKQFREERELSVLLAVDVSASSDLASAAQSKRELAAEVAACLAFSAASNGDKAGLVLFTDGVERYLPPRKGRRQVLRIMREVLHADLQGRGTSLEHALNFLNHVQHRRAIVFLITDFLDRNFERALKVTARHHDLIPIVITDGRERELPDAGWLAVEDAESGEIVEIDTGDRRVRERFAQLSHERIRGLRAGFRRLGAESIELDTDAPYLQPLRAFMERRLRRRRP
ncbi:MAG: DUF58 domain-containing protein [Steroidobacteraceae bacterium]